VPKTALARQQFVDLASVSYGINVTIRDGLDPNYDALVTFIRDGQAVGFNIASEPERYEAIKRAMSTGGVVATNPITFFQGGIFIFCVFQAIGYSKVFTNK
jgi:hypothetical protein